MSNHDFRAIAAQLAHPTGPEGVLVAERMNQSNADMTRMAVELLDCKPSHHVVEIGPGNGRFADYVLEQAEAISYSGVDISDTMLEEANRINRVFVDAGTVSFKKTDGLTLPYKQHSADRIFSVNTIYFWPDPVGMVHEIRRVLKPDGLCCIAYASREFMEGLPFTDELFKLYSVDEGVELFSNNGFNVIDTRGRNHPTVGPGRANLLRDEIFVCLKPG